MNDSTLTSGKIVADLNNYLRFIKIFDVNLNQMDATAYSFNKLEISLELLLNFTAQSAQMSDTEFEMYVYSFI